MRRKERGKEDERKGGQEGGRSSLDGERPLINIEGNDRVRQFLSSWCGTCSPVRATPAGRKYEFRPITADVPCCRGREAGVSVGDLPDHTLTK